MNTKHTPGPWEVIVHITGDLQVCAPDGHRLALLEDSRRSSQQDQADAFLIMAAPDLLAALELVQDAIAEDRELTCAAVLAVDAAIRRARGAG